MSPVSKPRKFRLHFNRIAMQRGKAQVWTIHLSDQCIPASSVVVRVPVRTVYRSMSVQPRAWFEGRGRIQRVKDYYHVGVYEIVP